MKTTIAVSLWMLFLVARPGMLQAQSAALPSPLEIVNQRMSSYNEHDFERFIQLYHADVKIYTYPDKLLATGVDNIRSIFYPKFAAKSIHVKIVHQMTNGNHVINHEIVTENGLETKYISIYEVQEGRISSVRFVRDH